MLTLSRPLAGMCLRHCTPAPVRALLLALTLFSLAASTCYAATLYVSPSGNDNNSGTQAAPYLHIQSAISNANPGDTVTLEDGLYTGPEDVDLDFGGKNLTVNSVNGASKTTIDCGGNATSNPIIEHHAFHFHTNESAAVITGLTMQNSYESSNGNGWAVYIASGCSVTLNNCIFANNTTNTIYSGPTGGGIGNAGTVTLNSCNFTGNTGSGGGGLVNQGTATLTNCNFTGNYGDGMENSGTATLTTCTSNTNTGRGINSGGTITLLTCTLNGNTGGGFASSYQATLIGCTITNNTIASRNGGGVNYGSIYNGAFLTMTGCTLSGNIATQDSNNNGNGQGGGLYLASNGATLTGCTIIKNMASGSGGGVANTGGATLINCLVAGNTTTSSNGGGVYNSSSALLEFCTFTSNKATAASAQGGGLENDGTATLTDTILYGDTASFNNEIGFATTGNPVTTATYSDIQGGLSGTGNIKTNPMFVNAPTDLHLQAGSLCLGAGTSIPGITTDLLGNTRGNPPSIGAYERAFVGTPVTLTSSLNPSTSGQSVTFTATVAGRGAAPTGTVTFTIDGTAQAPVTLSGSGTAAYSTSALAIGMHSITAAYSGDMTYGSGSAAPLTQTVNPLSAATYLISSPNPSVLGQTVRLTASVLGNNPTGIITFTDMTTGTILGTAALSGKTAVLTTAGLSAGSHQIVASYGGDSANNPGVSAARTQTVISPQTHVLWHNTMTGQSALWAVSVSGGVTAQGYGPYAGWTSVAIADDPNELAHLLWTNTDKQIAVWSVAADGTPAAIAYGPVAGWSALALAVGPDSHVHVLWNHDADSEMALWDIAPGAAPVGVTFGPYAGYTASKLAVSPDNHVHVLWTVQGGGIALWDIPPGAAPIGYGYGGPADSTALSLSTGPDSHAHVLWSHSPDNQMILWDVDTSGRETAGVYTPYAGYAPISLAVGVDAHVHVLWDAPNGGNTLWDVAPGAAPTAALYNPGGGWAAIAVSAAP